MLRSAKSSHGEDTDNFAVEGRFGSRAEAGLAASERVEQDSLAGYVRGAHRTNARMGIGPRLARFRLQVDPPVISVVVSSLSASWRILDPC